MNPFVHLKVSHRLYLVYGVAILFSLAIYGMVLFFLDGLERANVQVFDQEVKARILTQSITADLNMLSRLSRNLMLGGDYDKNLTQIHEVESAIRTGFDQLPGALADPDDLALAESSRRSTLAFVDKVLALAAEMRALAPEQRHTLFPRYEREATPPAQESRKYFGALSTRAEQHFQEAEANAKQQFDQLRAALNLAMPIFVALLTLIILAILRSIIRPLHELIAAFSAISSGAGNLTQRLVVHDRHELGAVAEGFNTFAASIQQLIGRMHHHSSDAVGAAFQLETDAEEALTRVEESAAQTAALATASEEMTATTESIAESCSHAADSARQASRIAHQGAEVVQRSIGMMHEVAQKVRASAETVKELGARSVQIGAIVGAIKEIADQTNLLALNAAIEAARAGEQGRGFAVVADEVRTLAERTNRATREIADMIQAIQRETAKAVASMELGVVEAEQGSADAARSGDALSDILSSANEVTQEIDQIATATEELAATNNEVSRNILGISDLTQGSLALSRRTEATADHMLAIFHQLQSSLDRFTSDEDVGSIVHKAKSAHLNFIRSIKQHLRGQAGLQAGTLPDHRGCAFGLWYQGPGQARFSGNHTFREIEPHHREVHELGKRALQAHDVGEHGQAEAHYHDMVGTSQRLLHLLDQLAG